MELQESQQLDIQSKKQRREVIVDLARGFAVALMILTHVIGLTYDTQNANNSLIYFIGEFGGIASFTTFLFLSGVGSYFSILKYPKGEVESIKNAKKKIWSKTLKLLIIYYILALLSGFVLTNLYSLPPSIQWAENAIGTFTFMIVPPFVEFLPTLMILWLSLIFFRKFYRYLSENALLALFISALLFLLGQLLYNVTLPSAELNSIKGLFAGDGSLHYFPVLQYFPIFMVGILFGRFLFFTEDKKKRNRVAILWTAATGLISLGFIIIFGTLQIPSLNPFAGGRFPPTVAFLIFSLFCALSIYLVISLTYRFIPRLIKVFLHYCGVNALELFFFHLVVLFAWKYLTTNNSNPSGAQYQSTLDIVIVYVITMILSIVLTNLKNSLKKWALNGSDRDATWWFFSEKAVSTVIFIGIFMFLATTVYRDFFVKPAQANTSEYQLKKRAIQEEEWPKWWNYEYKSSREVNITNNSSFPLFPGTWVGLTFNHKEALGKGSAIRPDGYDVRIVRYNFDEGEFQELPFIFEGINTENAKIYFKVVDTIGLGESSDNYFIYYGNEFTEIYPQASDRFTSPPAEYSLGDELSQNISAKVNKRWFLKKKETAYQAASLLFEANIASSQITPNSVLTYSVSNTNKSGSMKKIGDTKYQAAVVVSDLNPGVYRIQANVIDSSDGISIKRSFKIPFYVTYPLYVSWTIDWEGWDVDQSNLNDMANIADSNGIPMTHFFNPRIYISNQYTINKISPERATYLTNWVKDRQKNKFEEIGLHIHMWSDMVAAAGVTPRTTKIQGTYGVDVPTYAYTQEEIEKVLKWGRLQLVNNDLGAPVSYRTGAWMSGTNVLLAAQNAGFLIDSSGRTGGPVNPTISYSTQVPWSLSETTKPYYPNTDNINTWTGDMSKRMKIFEIPNNGADSYWFSAGELVKRFDLNYPNKGDILYSPQVVTYLSHPHWFVSQDSWKIKNLFKYTNQYLYKNDQGPVVYETLENIYSEWDREKYINGN